MENCGIKNQMELCKLVENVLKAGYPIFLLVNGEYIGFDPSYLEESNLCKAQAAAKFITED